MLTSKKEFLNTFFDKLKEKEVNYCVLRGYEGLPNSFEHDIDMLLDKKYLTVYEDILSDLSTKLQWQLVRTAHRYEFHTHVFINSNNHKEFILLDIWTDINYKSYNYINTKYVLDTKVLYNNKVYTSTHGAECAISFTKELFQLGKVKDKIKSKLQILIDSNEIEFKKTLKPVFTDEQINFFIEVINKGEWSLVENQIKFLRNNILKYNIDRYGTINSLGKKVKFLYGHFSDKITHKSGLFITLIGPDGSGKTTTSNELKETMKGIFTNINYYHGRFFILPDLKVLKGKKSKKQDIDKDFDRYKEVKKIKPHSSLKGILYILYYLLDFILGYIVIFKAKSNSELIVFDRYFYDYLIQEDFKNVPRWFIKSLLKIVPTPDIVVWLKAPAEEIFKRKPELSIEELTKQQKECELIINLYKEEGKIVSSFGSYDDTMENIKNIICLKLNKKAYYATR